MAMRASAPSLRIVRAEKRLMASKCTHNEAAVTPLENRLMMPSSFGKNWGLKPPVIEHACLQNVTCKEQQHGLSCASVTPQLSSL